ncbi:nucleotide exchange factor GrpE [Natronorarus salvus]|uniref:nucleotide exchange factor GrpE n=1 Tax=Natronorarus salvus TaxID=3117733 RepID=UPI002F265493
MTDEHDATPSEVAEDDATGTEEREGDGEVGIEAESNQGEVSEGETVGTEEDPASSERVDELEAELIDREERIDDLEADLAEREERIEELESSLRRVQADFQNYKKRRQRQEDQLRETATEDLVSRLVGVRDNLVRALSQDEEADIRPGVESTLSEFDRVLEEENVRAIEPEPGTEVDPQRHEVMMRVESDRPEGTVEELYTPGYEMGEKVLRAAQVTVSDGEETG